MRHICRQKFNNLLEEKKSVFNERKLDENFAKMDEIFAKRGRKCRQKNIEIHENFELK